VAASHFCPYLAGWDREHHLELVLKLGRRAGGRRVEEVRHVRLGPQQQQQRLELEIGGEAACILHPGEVKGSRGGVPQRPDAEHRLEHRRDAETHTADGLDVEAHIDHLDHTKCLITAAALRESGCMINPSLAIALAQARQHELQHAAERTRISRVDAPRRERPRTLGRVTIARMLSAARPVQRPSARTLDDRCAAQRAPQSTR
jgi:hypothetical protein